MREGVERPELPTISQRSSQQTKVSGYRQKVLEQGLELVGTPNRGYLISRSVAPLIWWNPLNYVGI